MKNFLFIIIIVGFLAVGGSFFLMNYTDIGNISPLQQKTTQYNDKDDQDQISTNSKTSLDPISFELSSQEIIFEDGTESTFRVAEGFHVAVSAEGLGKARFMAMSPDGRMFVADLVNMNLSHEGKIYILEDFNEETKRFQTKSTYLSSLRGPNSIAFYTDKNGKEWIYIALSAHIIRYPYSAGDTKPSGSPEIIATFPDKQVPGEVSIVWHITRTIMFYNNRLYVSVGSGCNSCEQPDGEMRAMIYSMDPDGGDKRIYADGLRNAVGFTFSDGELYATTNGVDHLGVSAPDDVMYRITKGEHYGWPYCYESGGNVYSDTYKIWKKTFSCEQVPLSFATFGPHAAPLGIRYFPQDSHPILKDTFIVALHGSFIPKKGSGYSIVRVAKNGEQEVFMDGFLIEQSSNKPERIGRPVDILQKDANSFFFTDDYDGRMYYVYAR